jgi:probable blue pigment (indigoidine) exporter
VALVTLLAPVSWGTTYITITELLPDGRPLLVACLRVLPAGLALAGYGLVAHRWRPRRTEWLRIGTLGLLNFGFFFPLLILAIYRLPGGVAASIGGIQPLLVAGISYLVRREPIDRRSAAIGVVAAFGVGLVVVRPGAAVDWLGVGAAAAANLSFATGVVLTKTWPTPEHKIAATGWQLLIAAAMIAPLTSIIEGPPPQLDSIELAGFAYLSLLATGAAFILWFQGIRMLPTQAPPVLGLAAPITGAILGWIVLGENLTGIQILGFFTTIGAITYATTHGSRPATARTQIKAQHTRTA